MDRELRADVSICRATRSRLSDSSSCVCLALCVRRAGGEMDSTRLPAPTSHPTSLPNRPAIPDCTNPAHTAQLLCLKDLEQTRPFFSFACSCASSASVRLPVSAIGLESSGRVRAQQAVSSLLLPLYLPESSTLKSPR